MSIEQEQTPQPSEQTPVPDKQALDVLLSLFPLLEAIHLAADGTLLRMEKNYILAVVIGEFAKITSASAVLLAIQKQLEGIPLPENIDLTAWLLLALAAYTAGVINEGVHVLVGRKRAEDKDAQTK